MDVEAVTKRMLRAYNYTRYKELTDTLNIAHTAIAGWRRRGKVAKTALLQCSSETGTTMEYLITGEGKQSDEKITKNEFRFVFERLFTSAKMSGVLREGENYSNQGMINISDQIFDAVTGTDVFKTLFDDKDNSNGDGSSRN